MNKLYSLGCACLLSSTFMVSPSLSGATITWDESSNGSIDASWSNTANWTSGGLPSTAIPSTLTDVLVGTTPVAGVITLDTGVTSNTVNSITFANGIGSAMITPGGVETLTVTSSITNSGTVQQQFGTAVFAGGTSTWSGSLKFTGTVQINNNTVNLVGLQAFANDLSFSITSVTSFGKFTGSTQSTYAPGVNINIVGAYTGVSGDVFDFTTGNFNNATLNLATLPTLTAGLDWNTSQFISSGILTVVSAIPEPSTYAALLGVLVLGMAASRKRRPSA